MEAKMPDFEEDAYVDSFKPHMMDVVHAWAGGATFAKIMEKTPVFEGKIFGAVCLDKQKFFLSFWTGLS